ncbi:hypothetical protein N0V82_000982 [Gnomoniopsis sp. IMI 355080]|nr:hypothetical protein N0V82_000982 [Gnomoniopsis sp. IMI 355080]
MDKLKDTVSRIFRLQLTNELPTTSKYRPVDLDEPKDRERLLTSPTLSGEPDRTARETLRDTCDCVCHQETPLRRVTPARIHFCASLFWMLGAFLILLVFRRDSINVPANGTFGWSPVVDDGANEYVEYTFPFFDLDPGEEKWNNKPTYEMDVRWFESYNWLSKVPTQKAQQGVPNGTIPIPGDEENSVVWLGVFHELHCANVLRKLIWFEYYSVMADLVAGRNNMRNHLVHCLDAIRKGIMCHADIAPVPFWSKPDFKNSEITPMFKIPHTCRNYDRILDWAKDHRIEKFECVEPICGTLGSITMTVEPGDPQPTHWPDPDATGPKVYTPEDEKILNCGKSVLDWC